MKYLVVLCDGMADEPIEKLGGKTPMQVANKPTMDKLAKKALVGNVLNTPETMVPESDTANLAVMSYDPLIYSKGRSPLEAYSMGLQMSDTMTAFRCNVVTLSEEEENYDDKIMLDNSADEITTEEADVLIKAIEKELARILETSTQAYPTAIVCCGILLPRLSTSPVLTILSVRELPSTYPRVRTERSITTL